MKRDLGTYHLRVELQDGRGWIQTFNTGWRYTHGDADVTRLDAQAISPTWESEEALLHSMRFMYEDGNYSCDCNKNLFLMRSHQMDDTDCDCGDTMPLAKLTAIRPDRSEVVIFP